MRKNVGSLIRSKRQRLQCSQEAVATALGVSIKFISLVENGQRQLPTSHFKTVSEFLEIPIEEILDSKLKDSVGKKLEKDFLRKFRGLEIEESLRFLAIKKSGYESQLEMLKKETNRVTEQIKVLIEEKEMLGLGQLIMKV